MNNVALLFPGQGSQYIGMCGELCKTYPIAKKVFDDASKVLGFDLLDLCLNGELKELTKTDNAQVALLAASVAMFKVYMEEVGVEPKYMLGNSLGEISALTCAGVIEFHDAVKIVRKRGQLMQDAVPEGRGTMASVSDISVDIIEETCKKISSNENIVVISNYNTVNQTVISGHREAVSIAIESLKELGATAVLLNVSGPFHSSLMKPVADEFEKELRNYTFNNLKYPVISNVTALPYESREDIIKLLVLQIVEPVQWKKSIDYLQNKGVEIAVELGAKNVLKNMIKKSSVQIEAFSFDREIEGVINKLAVDKNNTIQVENQKIKLITRCLAIAVCTKNSNWNNDEYTMGVVEPYREVKAMLESLENNGEDPTFEQMNKALDMLKSVFKTKKTDVDEQIERYNQLFSETGLKNLFHGFEIPTK